jgi:hypothetical protein
MSKASPSVTLSVKLSDGTLESSVTVPLDAPQVQKDEAVARWLKVMMFGLSMPGEMHIATDLGMSQP